MDALFLIIAGAAAAGFVNGLAGFGTALFSLGFWLQVFSPVQAVAMTLIVSCATGLQGLWVVRREIRAQKRRLLRFLIPALFGIPLGLLALGLIEPRPLKFLIAGFMLVYAAFFLIRRKLPHFDRPTPAADAGIGLLGGFLGGLAGLSGALPAMWCALRPWPRHETRAVLQPFNVVVLAISAAFLAVQGAYTTELLLPLAIALAVAVATAQIGIMTFKRISDSAFRWLIIALMLVSGLVLIARELF